MSILVTRIEDLMGAITKREAKLAKMVEQQTKAFAQLADLIKEVDQRMTKKESGTP